MRGSNPAAVDCADGVRTLSRSGAQRRIDATSMATMKSSLQLVRDELAPAHQREFDAAMEALLMQRLQAGSQREVAEIKAAYQADPDTAFLRVAAPLLHGRTADEVLALANGVGAR